MNLQAGKDDPLIATGQGNLNFMKPDKEEAIKGVRKCSEGRKWPAWLPT